MNILLIQLKRIGDLILTTPAIAALRERFPEATLTLVVSPSAEQLLPAISGIDRVFVVRGKADDALDWIGLTLTRFDYCLDFTRNDLRQREIAPGPEARRSGASDARNGGAFFDALNRHRPLLRSGERYVTFGAAPGWCKELAAVPLARLSARGSAGGPVQGR